jgi:hypothetical protein
MTYSAGVIIPECVFGALCVHFCWVYTKEHNCRVFSVFIDMNILDVHFSIYINIIEL